MPKYTIKVDKFQYILDRDGVVQGYFNTLEGLLHAARERLLKDKTKSGASLLSLVETAERKDREAKVLLTIMMQELIAQAPAKS